MNFKTELTKVFYFASAVLWMIGCQTRSDVYTQSSDGEFVLVAKSNDPASSLSRFAEPKPVKSRQSDAEAEISAPTNAPQASAQPYIDLARIELLKGDVDKAREYTSKALRLDLQSRDATKLLVEVELASGNFKKAELIIARFLTRGFESDADVLTFWTKIYENQKNWPAVYLTLNKILSLDNRRIDAWMNRGIFELQMSQYEKARASFVQALNLTPLNPDAHLMLGLSFMRLKEWSSAEASLRRACELDDQSGLAKYYLASTLEKQLLYEDSFKSVEAALASDKSTLSGGLRIQAEKLRDKLIEAIKLEEEKENAKG